MLEFTCEAAVPALFALWLALAGIAFDTVSAFVSVFGLGKVVADEVAAACGGACVACVWCKEAVFLEAKVLAEGMGRASAWASALACMLEAWGAGVWYGGGDADDDDEAVMFVRRGTGGALSEDVIPRCLRKRSTDGRCGGRRCLKHGLGSNEAADAESRQAGAVS